MTVVLLFRSSQWCFTASLVATLLWSAADCCHSVRCPHSPGKVTKIWWRARRAKVFRHGIPAPPPPLLLLRGHSVPRQQPGVWVLFRSVPSRDLGTIRYNGSSGPLFSSFYPRSFTRTSHLAVSFLQLSGLSVCPTVCVCLQSHAVRVFQTFRIGECCVAYSRAISLREWQKVQLWGRRGRGGGA